MGWRLIVHRLINHALERSVGFREKLEELQTKSYAFEAPFVLIRFLYDLNTSIENKLFEYKDIIVKRENYDFQSLLYLVQPLVQLLDLYYQLSIPIIENSRTVFNPPSISLPIERLAMGLCPDNIALVYPSPLVNYSYFNILSRDYLRSEEVTSLLPEGYFQNCPGFFAIIAYPLMLRENSLSHTVITHELGHFFGESQQVFDEILGQGSTDETETEALVPPTTLRSYFEEYVSDLISIRLFGPASFFASTEFASSRFALQEFPLERLSHTHPPLVFRMKNMIDALRQYSYFDFFDNKDPKLRSVLIDWDNILNNLIDNFDQDIKSIVFDALMQPLGRARVLIEQKLENRFKFKPNDKIFEYVNRFIEPGIPPSAELLQDNKGIKSQSIDLATILNTAWIYRIRKFDAFEPITTQSDASKYTERLKSLSRLIKKTIEQHEMFEHFQRKRNRR